jgi:hypothetical protein
MHKNRTDGLYELKLHCEFAMGLFGCFFGQVAWAKEFRSVRQSLV